MKEKRMKKRMKNSENSFANCYLLLSLPILLLAILNCHCYHHHVILLTPHLFNSIQQILANRFFFFLGELIKELTVHDLT